ncbi:hypothetical protein C8R44DRAFT_744795 [Mycena epipterygia]|nr:hypothetical protein C8R44DRAFT_744795 [Mycena epipterygia]
MYSTGFEAGLSARIGLGCVYVRKKDGSLPSSDRCEIPVEANRRRRALDGGVQLKGGLGLGFREIVERAPGVTTDSSRQICRSPPCIVADFEILPPLSTQIMHGLETMDRYLDGGIRRCVPYIDISASELTVKSSKHPAEDKQTTEYETPGKFEPDCNQRVLVRKRV